MKFSQNPVALRSCQITFDFSPCCGSSVTIRHGQSPHERSLFAENFPDKTQGLGCDFLRIALLDRHRLDRKSTRLNSSHVSISYAVFCLKKKIANNHTCL